MMNIEVPSAFTLASLTAVSSASADWLFHPRFAFKITPWSVSLFLLALGCVSSYFGILNPETMSLVGLDGIVAP
jgi:hypothetical protein